MSNNVVIQKSGRGVVGQVAKWLFIGFNGLMAVWFFVGVGAASNTVASADGDAERAGAAIGTFLGASAIIFFWLAGAVILGLFALLTRGKQVIVYTAPSPTEGLATAATDDDRPKPSSPRSAATVAAWIVSVLLFVGATGSLLDGRVGTAIGILLVGLCAFPPLWRHPAVAKYNIPVWTRWLSALLLLVVVGSLSQADTVSKAAPSAAGSGAKPVVAESEVQTKWSISDETSPLDDSHNVYASVRATNKVAGWLTSETPTLQLRCKEHKLDAYVDTGSQLTSDYDLDYGQRVSVTYRVGSGAPVQIKGSESSDGTAFFIPGARTFVTRLRGADKFVVEYTPFQAGMGTATFNIAGADAAADRLLAACPQ